MYKRSERELRFPLAVSVSYQNGDRGKHGEVVRGYVACDLDDRTPTQVERRYRKRSAIETSYRLFRQARATTTTQDPLVRFAFVIVSFLLENLWLVLRWAVVARPRPRACEASAAAFVRNCFVNRSRHSLCSNQTDASIQSATAPRLNGSHQLNSASEFSIGKYRDLLEFIM
jgi:IS4 transposase